MEFHISSVPLDQLKQCFPNFPTLCGRRAPHHLLSTLTTRKKRGFMVCRKCWENFRLLRAPRVK
jgi:hypothetical protein